ncbi:MAG: YbjN domain-containing protein [Dermatophilaceae bacterium]
MSDADAGAPPAGTAAVAGAAARLTAYLHGAEIAWEPGPRDGEYVLTLPGERKQRTVVSLLLREGVTSVSAFVIRNPDENHEAFYRFLLRRNLRLPMLAYAVDASGDVYVRGSLPTAAVDEQWLDHLMGALLTAADEPFNELLALGFLESMKKEWAWRVSRGESLANLEAFRHLLEGAPRDDAAAATGAAAAVTDVT